MLTLLLFGLLLIPLNTTSPATILIEMRIGEQVDERKFPFSSPELSTWLAGIDPSVIAHHEQTWTVNDQAITYQLQYSLHNTVIEPLVGNHPFIASIKIGESGFIELYNPTTETISLGDYRVIVNQTSYILNPEKVIPAQTSLTIDMVLGTPEIGVVDEENPIVLSAPATILHLWEAERFLYIDSVPLTEMMMTRFGEVPLADHVFYREAFIVNPETTFTPSSWYALDATIPWQAFTPLAPLTPLIQAKAWATDVMFGAGMFAAGRVEAAFRALETEYWHMALPSQLMLFDAPNTHITGINERGNLDRSTFREAVGRYNYLAARVPGAAGLINPNPSPFPVVTLGIIGGSLLGLFGVFAYLKSRYQKV